MFRGMGPQSAVPLYLRYEDRSAAPLISHNAESHNLLVRVTVPKSTGRKRKRGSDAPWEPDPAAASGHGLSQDAEPAASALGLEDARVLQRKLQDNAGRYTAEVVSQIRQTHRFRGRSMPSFPSAAEAAHGC